MALQRRGRRTKWESLSAACGSQMTGAVNGGGLLFLDILISSYHKIDTVGLAKTRASSLKRAQCRKLGSDREIRLGKVNSGDSE